MFSAGLFPHRIPGVMGYMLPKRIPGVIGHNTSGMLPHIIHMCYVKEAQGVTSCSARPYHQRVFHLRVPTAATAPAAAAPAALTPLRRCLSALGQRGGPRRFGVAERAVALLRQLLQHRLYGLRVRPGANIHHVI